MCTQFNGRHTVLTFLLVYSQPDNSTVTVTDSIDLTVQTLLEVLGMSDEFSSSDENIKVAHQKETCVCDGHFCNRATKGVSMHLRLIFLAAAAAALTSGFVHQ
jgi:hypothetical protein